MQQLDKFGHDKFVLKVKPIFMKNLLRYRIILESKNHIYNKEKSIFSDTLVLFFCLKCIFFSVFNTFFIFQLIIFYQ